MKATIYYKAQSVLAWGQKYLRVYRVLLERPAESFVFLGLTLGVGAFALWAPPLIAWVYSLDILREFVKALEIGAGYMFALITVATALTFVAKEYLADRPSEFKELKIIGAVIAGCLILLLALLLGIQITAGILQPTRNLPITSLTIQTVLTVIGFLVALYLFCLEQIDDFPDLGVDVKDRSKAVLRKAINAAKDPDLRL